MLEEINDLLTQIDMMLVNLKEKNEQLQIEYEMIIMKLVTLVKMKKLVQKI